MDTKDEVIEMLMQQLALTNTNLRRGLSKSMQRMQASSNKEIMDECRYRLKQGVQNGKTSN